MISIPTISHIPILLTCQSNRRCDPSSIGQKKKPRDEPVGQEVLTKGGRQECRLDLDLENFGFKSNDPL